MSVSVNQVVAGGLGSAGSPPVTGTGNVVMSESPTIGGTITASGGRIAFPAVQSPSADPNTLDDYEEGTWTPVIEGSSSAGAGTYTAQSGRYTKVGNRVFISCSIGWSAHTGTGNINLSGLPFTPVAGSTDSFFCLADGLTITGLPVFNINGASTTMYLVALNNGGTGLVALDAVVGAFRFSGHYNI